MYEETVQETLVQPEAFYGDAQDLIYELGRHGEHDKVVAVFVSGVAGSLGSAIGEAIAEVVKMVPTVIRNQRELDLQAYLNLMLPKEVVPGRRLREMKMVAEGMRRILESGEFVTSSTIADLANFSRTNPSAQPSKWKREKSIFSFTYQREDYFPLFALQQADSYRPHRMLKDIIRIFDGKKDGWGIALWFLSDNSYLGGRPPKDVLNSDPEAVLAAANEEVSEVLHG